MGRGASPPPPAGPTEVELQLVDDAASRQPEANETPRGVRGDPAIPRMPPTLAGRVSAE
jgi:hypothetical protein